MLNFAFTGKLMIMNKKRFFIIISAVVLLLLVPFIAMQFTSEVNWSVFDFMVAAALLLGTGMLGEYLLRKMKNNRQRILIVLALLAALFIIWVELAVGIF